MPIGSLDAVPQIARYFLFDRPSSVLDLGMGSGFYGAVVRQWADEGVRPWKTWLVGVDAWADYRNPAWDFYDLVYVCTIDGYLAGHAESFDCVLLNDVLEHYEHSAGGLLLDRLKTFVSPGGSLFVSTPARFCPQGAEHGNPYEQHRSIWTAAELEARDFRTHLSGHEPQVGGVPAVLSQWTQSR